MSEPYETPLKRCEMCGVEVFEENWHRDTGCCDECHDEGVENGDISIPKYPLQKAVNDNIFISHIQTHLKEGEKVICKICGKSAEEIINEVMGEWYGQKHEED